MSQKPDFSTFKNATPAEIETAKNHIITARVHFMNQLPFYGTLTTDLKLVPNDTFIPTAGVDGRRFWFNPKFINWFASQQHGRQYMRFLMAHEVHHCAYNHFKRRNNRHPLLWNIANDYAINNQLKRFESKSRDTLRVPVWAYCDLERFADKPSEEIYEILKADKEFLKQLAENSTGFQLVDYHPDFDDVFGEFYKSDSELEAESQFYRRKLTQAYQFAKGSRDRYPGDLMDFISDLVEPKIDWRTLLQKRIKAHIKVNYSWMRPHKKGQFYDVILPGMEPGEKVDIHIAFDISGSISEQQLREFLSEVFGICAQFSNINLTVFSFDSEVHNVKVYNSYNITDLKQYPFRRGGGTDFQVIFDWCKQNSAKPPNELVVFTDGYPCGEWGDAHYCPTVWVINGGKNIVPPFGKYAIYES